MRLRKARNANFTKFDATTCIARLLGSDIVFPFFHCPLLLLFFSVGRFISIWRATLHRKKRFPVFNHSVTGDNLPGARPIATPGEAGKPFGEFHKLYINRRGWSSSIGTARARL